MPYLHNRDRNLLDSIHYPSWKYLCTIVSFSEASFLIGILQGIKVSSFKLKKIFYENNTPSIRNPVYSRYNDQKIDVIIIDDCTITSKIIEFNLQQLLEHLNTEKQNS